VPCRSKPLKLPEARRLVEVERIQKLFCSCLHQLDSNLVNFTLFYFALLSFRFILLLTDSVRGPGALRIPILRIDDPGAVHTLAIITHSPAISHWVGIKLGSIPVDLDEVHHREGKRSAEGCLARAVVIHDGAVNGAALIDESGIKAASVIGQLEIRIMPAPVPIYAFTHWENGTDLTKHFQ